jgi:deoxyribodipyrimidine photolyase-related protein
MRYPVTHEEAEKWFSEFVSQRLAGFGTHYGALSRRSMIAYHSVLSPLLNSGLLIPERVMSRVGANEAFIAGMIRREFMRALYVNPGTNGVDHPHSAVPTRNFVGVRRRLSPNWYDAATGIDPVDTAIAAVQRFAYTPHTDRALLGTAMLMCDVAPGAVYRWFMEMFVDSYNWTLVGPVMCVSQHSYGPVSDGPYLPSAAKIRETSDYAAGAWCAKWDALLARMRSKRHAALGITRGPDEPEAVRTANRLLTLI